MAEPALRRGEQVWLAGLTTGDRVVRRRCTVTSATFSVTVRAASVPRFRAVHEEVCPQDWGGIQIRIAVMHKSLRPTGRDRRPKA